MPGMNTGLNIDNPTVVAAFRSALLHQGIIALLIFAVLGLAWLTVRAWLPAAARRPGEKAAPGASAAAAVAEPAGRRLLRIGFGLLWLFDGILQAQPKMAIGLPSQVIEPIAASSPPWVQHVVNWAGTTWSYHPMQAGASAVWIQIGIGVWMLAASRGPLSRLAGLVGVGWGLVVWVFGEAFGGIFAPGLTWLFGAPGGVLLYCVAGALIALPEREWNTPRLGRRILAGLGLFLIGMAVLQAWPGRGFWQGIDHGRPGTLAGMTSTMAQIPQPHVLSSLVNAFTGFDEAHGFAVNLFVVVALAVIGGMFLSGRRRLVHPALIAFIVLCLADWVLIEDLGFLGGLGTDPNSMIPFVLLAAGGYLTLTRVPVTAQEPAATEPARPKAARAGWRERLRPAFVQRGLATASFRTVAAVGALGVIILGAAPMAAAQASRNADPVLAQTLAGNTAPLNLPAKNFQLTDQHGRAVSLASLRGKVVLLTFLDPVCTSDCPLIAQEFRDAGQLLGDSSRVELVAIVANPIYHQVADVQAFNRQESLNQVPNWLFLTGSLSQLEQAWEGYGIPIEILPGGAMINHPDVAFVINQKGYIREELNTDPGPGTAATKSSFATLLADAARQVMSSP
jgi:cytochrome oxidase Cu insertion factor (SCO1/SenC/PrrC family)